MPGQIGPGQKTRKRKRNRDLPLPGMHSEKRSVNDADGSYQSEILQLEESISGSRQHYNSIPELLELAREPHGNAGRQQFALVASCRIFCRLMAVGSMTSTGAEAENDAVIQQWLKERYVDYQTIVLNLLGTGDFERQSAALTLSMQLVKEEASHLKLDEQGLWKSGVFPGVVRTLVMAGSDDRTRERFVKEFVEEYDDIRFHTFTALADIALKNGGPTPLRNMISMLSLIENIPKSEDQIADFYVEPPVKKKHEIYALRAHKKRAQEAWMTLLQLDISRAHRKSLLGFLSYRIAPWFLKVELLMDFLTDSFDEGGSVSLMALSGLFYLIQEKNLDYPYFYQKLYSLIDVNILHSKHRSRFFRLLNHFLASTHLPAALVASFIKRLSRLCLHSPPSGIVTVVPWMYNILKAHPTCTFMMHRDVGKGEPATDHREEIDEDPFRMDEHDPMLTNAEESSLWEIECLQSHYHPNVATIAKILSQPFTKQSYSLEDFLDHSYASMLEAELSKDIKKPPVVEYDLPKRVFTSSDMEPLGGNSLMLNLWNFSVK